MKRGTTIADLASEFLAQMSGSAGEGSSVVVVPTPTDPAGIRRCARDLKTWSADRKHTNEERGDIAILASETWRTSRSVASTLEDLSCRV